MFFVGILGVALRLGRQIRVGIRSFLRGVRRSIRFEQTGRGRNVEEGARRNAKDGRKQKRRSNSYYGIRRNYYYNDDDNDDRSDERRRKQQLINTIYFQRLGSSNLMNLPHFSPCMPNSFMISNLSRSLAERIFLFLNAGDGSESFSFLFEIFSLLGRCEDVASNRIRRRIYGDFVRFETNRRN